MTSLVFTRTDVAANDWSIHDAIIQLRQWASNELLPLPTPDVAEWTVGAGPLTAIRLVDPSQLVSRLHARLTREGAQWMLRDAGSKNGIRVDGSRRSEICLAPGMEIGIGGITLVPESARWIELRNFVMRLLGWKPAKLELVDRALRAIRMAASYRAALVLCGDGDVVPLARSIHQHTRGSTRPFIVCDPKRHPGKETVRSAENYASGLEALSAATGGTLCIRTRRPPADFDKVVEAVSATDSRVQLAMCAETVEECERYGVVPIAVPPLSERRDEFDRIIADYAGDALTEFAGGADTFDAADHAWVRKHASNSLSEIEKATRRRVVLRISNSVTDAAARLGMAPVSLTRWLGRRGTASERTM